MEEAIKYVNFDAENDWFEAEPIIKALCFPNKWDYTVCGEGFRSFSYDLSERYHVEITFDPLDIKLVEWFDEKGKWYDCNKVVYRTISEKFNLNRFKSKLETIGF